MNEFEELMLTGLQDLKADVRELRSEVKEVRVTDVPALQTAVAGFNEKIEAVEKNQKWSTRAYTILGGVIAVAISKFTGTH